MAELPKTKVCTRCGQEKPLTEFHERTAGEFGREAICKACKSAEAHPAKKELTTISFSELSDYCGYKRPADVCSWCQRNGINYFLDKDKRPITTQKAIDKALSGGYPN